MVESEEVSHSLVDCPTYTHERWALYPEARGSTLRSRAEDTLIPFRGVPVFHVVKFTETNESEIIDSVHARPEQRDKRGRIVPSRFDTVLVESPSQDRKQGQIKGKFLFITS